MEPLAAALLQPARQVLLFSGHLIDPPGRSSPRFPAHKESRAADEIGRALDHLGAGPEDVGLTQGACGGDLLFTEACQTRGVRVLWLQPFREPEFIRNSVEPGGDVWRGRYENARSRLAGPILCLPDELAEPEKEAPNDSPYVRCNLWLLETALAFGAEKLRFICLWDGAGEEGPGGTAHMLRVVESRSGQIYWIDTRLL